MSDINSDLTYAEAIADLLKDKYIEVHTGDTRTIHEYSEMQLVKKSVLRGVVKGAKHDVLIMLCTTISGGQTIVYVNGWAITAVTEYQPGTNVVDIYHDEDVKDK